MTKDHENWNTHRWSGWPGAWCMTCGIEDPVENALGDTGTKMDDKTGELHPEPYCPPCKTGIVKTK